MDSIPQEMLEYLDILVDLDFLEFASEFGDTGLAILAAEPVSIAR